MEVLARLNPKGQSWGYSSSSFDPLTSAQISAACVGADSIGLTVLQWRVGQKTPSLGYYKLYNAVIGIGVRNKWNLAKSDKGKARIRLLLEVCLDDYAQPVKCHTCHGTGKNELHKDCGGCQGTGNKNRSNASRARHLGIHRSTYMRIWASRYKIVMNYFMDTLHEAEYQAKTSIRKGLKSA